MYIGSADLLRSLSHNVLHKLEIANTQLARDAGNWGVLNFMRRPGRGIGTED